MAKVGATTQSENNAPEYAGVCVKIKTVDNGVVVTAYPEEHRMDHETTNVFNSLDEALKEIPSIISVVKDMAKENKKPMNDAPMEMEEDY